MIIQPKTNNSIELTTQSTGIVYEIQDVDELGLCITKVLPKRGSFNVSVSILNFGEGLPNVDMIGESRVVYLDRKESHHGES